MHDMQRAQHLSKFDTQLFDKKQSLKTVVPATKALFTHLEMSILLSCLTLFYDFILSVLKDLGQFTLTQLQRFFIQIKHMLGT